MSTRIHTLRAGAAAGAPGTHDGWLRVRKRPREVPVAFARERGAVQTLEGPVIAEAGDAVLTGTQGERWPVTRGRFEARYTPAPGTTPGEDGLYLARPAEVRAQRWAEPFEVDLGGERGVLTGAAGDWLLDYGDGSLGVVAADIFEATYEKV